MNQNFCLECEEIIAPERWENGFCYNCWCRYLNIRMFFKLKEKYFTVEWKKEGF